VVRLATEVERLLDALEVELDAAALEEVQPADRVCVLQGVS
jgi:hypothetical protein